VGARVSTTPSATTAPASLAAANLVRLASWCLLIAVFLLCYGSTLSGLAVDWWNDPDYSFGLVAPFAIGYIIFLRRRSLLEDARLPDARAGLTIVACSQLLFLVGSVAAEFFLLRSSMVVLIVGAVLYLAGWNWLKRLLLPLLLLELCIPLPAVLLHRVSMPLQLISSSGAGVVLRGCGLPVYRSGNILELPHTILNVSEACSGMRSLASMVGLAIVLISSSQLAWWIRAIFVASAAVVAVAANTLRITGAGLLGEYVGRHATYGAWHSMEGWFVFVVSFVMLKTELAILHRFFDTDRQKVNV
jgi:exosortase